MRPTYGGTLIDSSGHQSHSSIDLVKSLFGGGMERGNEGENFVTSFNGKRGFPSASKDTLLAFQITRAILITATVIPAINYFINGGKRVMDAFLIMSRSRNG